ncbi:MULTISPECIES: hypothetical protein [Burkholderia]|uniref:hypothetical protein n=1 Tax=Burkholderia TaxID=32008 RepID=UPI0011AFC0C8|nr:MULTISPECIES: hypothetical protein [unclassified Burkholderia]
MIGERGSGPVDPAINEQPAGCAGRAFARERSSAAIAIGSTKPIRILTTSVFIAFLAIVGIEGVAVVAAAKSMIIPGQTKIPGNLCLADAARIDCYIDFVRPVISVAGMRFAGFSNMCMSALFMFFYGSIGFSLCNATDRDYSLNR